MRRLSLPVLVAVVAGCAGSPPPSTPAPVTRATPAANVITADALKRDLFIFAADSFRGRETGSADAVKAASFIARELKAAGLEPAGDTGFLQRVPLVRQRFGEGTVFSVKKGETVTALKVGKDLVPLINLGEGVPAPKRTAEGELAFAGYAIVDAALNRNDVTPALQGKIVVLVHGAPPNVDSATKKRLEAQTELSARLGRLLAFQPAGIIVLMSGGATEFFNQIAPELMRTVSLVGDEDRTPEEARRIPMILFGLAKPGSPLLPAGWPSDDRPQPLGGTFSGKIEIARDPFTAYNVVAIARGTDPALKGTYVAFGAHYDHVGTLSPVNGDSIANGADDDGSGSMAILSIARQMALGRGRRSTLFVWHVGEEKGLLGSAYFTAHPTVPLDSIVAQFNADMIGRNKPDDLYIVGPGAAPGGQSRVLGAIVDSVNKTLARPFTFNREWDTPDHPEQIYQRSDHFNYAKRGIPVVFYTTGLHDDYHKVTDEPAKIDYDKLARVARLMYEAGIAVANRPSRPK